jgi:hypothetical protein
VTTKTQQDLRYWPTTKAYQALGEQPPAAPPLTATLVELVDDLVAMDATGAIDLTRWAAAAALVDWRYPIGDPA